MTPEDRYLRPAYEGVAGGPAYATRKPAEGVLGPSTGDAAGAILRGRLESLARLTRGLEALVEEREGLRDDVLAAIDRDETTVSNLLLALYRPGVAGTDNPAYVKLRVELLRLERERRQAAVECWRDSALLSKDLVEQAERANEAARIGELLWGQGP